MEGTHKKYIPIFLDDAEAIFLLDNESAGRLLKGLLEYGISKQTAKILKDGDERFIFPSCKKKIDLLDETYEKKCRTNTKNAEKRWIKQKESACGGMPKDASACDGMQTECEPMRTHANQSQSQSQSQKQSQREKNTGVLRAPAQTPPEKQDKDHQAPVQWAEYVTMSNDEHDKLLAAYGEADTAAMIEILDNYKGSTGKRYKSDYRAILNWVVKRLEEDKRRAFPQPQQRPQSTGNPFFDLVASGALQDE